MRKRKIPRLIILLIFIIILIPITFSKYTEKTVVSGINLSVTAPKYWDEESFVSGGFKEGTVSIITNTERTIVIEAMGQSGANERIRIPIEDAEAGIYQLSFTVEMTGDNITVVDNTKYVYGCTIDGSETLARDSGFLWKSITPTQKENVCLTFEITEEEIQSNTEKYWIWNFANICDNKLFTLSLTNIEIAKVDAPSSPYIDFLNTEFLYLDTIEGATVSETVGMSSFVTTASYNEVVLRLETLSGCEHFVIPIKGLTANQTYTIYFDEYTTGTTLRNSGQYDYGAWVAASKTNILAKNVLYPSGVHYTQAQFPHHCIKSIGSVNKNNSFTFTATSSQMYWIWECADFGDGNWAKIHLSNARIEKATSAANSASVLSIEQENLPQVYQQVEIENEPTTEEPEVETEQEKNTEILNDNSLNENISESENVLESENISSSENISENESVSESENVLENEI